MSDNNIRISVILPSYNSEKYIARAINSFLDQDYEHKQLVIVDGKSTDTSHSIIEKFAENNVNILWIKEKDFNATDAINIGLKHCTGDFISFLGSDVYYFSNDIFSCINFSHRKIPFDCIYFDHYYYNTVTNSVYLHKCPNVPFTRNNLLQIGTIVGFDNIFISKEIYKRHQLNPKYNLCSDWEFYLRIVHDDSLFFYHEKICAVDFQDGNHLSSRYYDEQMAQVREVAALYNTDNVKLYFASPEIPPKTIQSRVKQKLKNLFMR